MYSAFRSFENHCIYIPTPCPPCLYLPSGYLCTRKQGDRRASAGGGGSIQAYAIEDKYARMALGNMKDMLCTLYPKAPAEVPEYVLRYNTE